MKSMTQVRHVDNSTPNVSCPVFLQISTTATLIHGMWCYLPRTLVWLIPVYSLIPVLPLPPIPTLHTELEGWWG